MGLPGDALAALLVGLVSVGFSGVLVGTLVVHAVARTAFGRSGWRVVAAVGAVGVVGGVGIAVTAVEMGFLSYVDPALYPVGWIVALFVAFGPLVASGLLLVSAARTRAERSQ